jgi:hypothetical protein
MTAWRSPKLTAKRVREVLDCDPSTGTLRWRERPGHPDFNARLAGKPAGKLDPTNGYLRLMIDGRHQYVHRMVWLHTRGYLPSKDLDHIDGDRTNCAISNLGPATRAQNNYNRRSRPRSRPSPRGSWQNRRGKFQVKIETGGANGKRGKCVYLGTFSTAEAAERAYWDGIEALHGEFAFTARPVSAPEREEIAA